MTFKFLSVFSSNTEVIHTTEYLIKPPKGQSFNNQNIKLNGIEPEYVKYSPSFDFYYHSFLKYYFKDKLIVFHNASMEKSCLIQLFEHYNIALRKPLYFIDTLQIAVEYDLPQKLSDLALYLGIEFNSSNHHTAGYDSEVCLRCFLFLKEKYGDEIFKFKKEIRVKDLNIEVIKSNNYIPGAYDNKSNIDKYNEAIEFIKQREVNKMNLSFKLIKHSIFSMYISLISL